MKSLKTASVIVGIMFCVLSHSANADYVNVAGFNISGSYAGTAGSPMPWNTSYWNLGSNGGYWGSTDGLTQYTGVTVPTVTFTLAVANGTYDLDVAQVCTANTPSSVFYFTVEGTAATVYADDGFTWVKDYTIGRYEVTDGELTITVPSASAGVAQWIGFTGFNVNAVPEPVTLSVLMSAGMIGLLRRRNK